MSLCPGVSVCLSVVSVCVCLPASPWLTVMSFDGLTPWEHSGLDFESGSEKLGQDNGGERACGTLN